MEKATREFYDKRGAVLVKNLQKHHFEAYYCSTKAEALEQVLAVTHPPAPITTSGLNSLIIFLHVILAFKN